MTPEQFAYWLNGFAELNQAPPTEAQWKSINEHLQTVFKKVTPQVVLASQIKNAVANDNFRSVTNQYDGNSQTGALC